MSVVQGIGMFPYSMTTGNNERTVRIWLGAHLLGEQPSATAGDYEHREAVAQLIKDANVGAAIRLNR